VSGEAWRLVRYLRRLPAPTVDVTISNWQLLCRPSIQPRGLAYREASRRELTWAVGSGRSSLYKVSDYGHAWLTDQLIYGLLFKPNTLYLGWGLHCTLTAWPCHGWVPGRRGRAIIVLWGRGISSPEVLHLTATSMHCSHLYSVCVRVQISQSQLAASWTGRRRLHFGPYNAIIDFSNGSHMSVASFTNRVESSPHS
jgi:hypothetical protein